MDLTDKNVLPTKLLVKRIVREQRFTASGLVIPDSAEEATCTGEIIIKGQGTNSVPMPMNVGQKVMYPPRAALRVKIEDTDYWLIDNRDVLLYW